jgi:hypothetical protein
MNRDLSAALDAGEFIFRPAGADRLPTLPTAYAVGCILTPLRGYRFIAKCFAARPLCFMVGD